MQTSVVTMSTQETEFMAAALEIITLKVIISQLSEDGYSDWILLIIQSKVCVLI